MSETIKRSISEIKARISFIESKYTSFDYYGTYHVYEKEIYVQILDNYDEKINSNFQDTIKRFLKIAILSSKDNNRITCHKYARFFIAWCWLLCDNVVEELEEMIKDVNNFDTSSLPIFLKISDHYNTKQ